MFNDQEEEIISNVIVALVTLFCLGLLSIAII